MSATAVANHRRTLLWTMGTLGVLAVVGVTSSSTPTRAQQTASSDACLDLRSVDSLPLIEAIASKRLPDITAALEDLGQMQRFAIPTDPNSGRRPYRSSYSIRFSDRQIKRSALSFLRVIRQQSAWRTLDKRQKSPRRIRVGDYGGTIRSLLAIANAFPDLRRPARTLAREIGDVALATSSVIGTPAVPIAPNALPEYKNAFIRAPLRRLLRQCPALQQALASGWLVTAKAPELHYGETARIGDAFIALTRDTGEQRFLQWTREASGWFSRHPFAADVHANAMAAGLDAELYTVSAEDKYLERALDRMTLTVLPAFTKRPGRPDSVPFIRRLPLRDLADITRALVFLSTAIATAPVGSIPPDLIDQVTQATRTAYNMLEKRALAGRRLQLPTHLIELAHDLERAQRAGAKLDPPGAEAFRHVLAHGADRLQRRIPLSGAASGLLLAKLKDRGWSGAHRTPKPNADATSASTN